MNRASGPVLTAGRKRAPCCHVRTASNDAISYSFSTDHIGDWSIFLIKTQEILFFSPIRSTQRTKGGAAASHACMHANTCHAGPALQPASSRHAVAPRSLRAPERAKPSGDGERARDLRIPCVFQPATRSGIGPGIFEDPRARARATLSKLTCRRPPTPKLKRAGLQRFILNFPLISLFISHINILSLLFHPHQRFSLKFPLYPLQL